MFTADPEDRAVQRDRKKEKMKHVSRILTVKKWAAFFLI